MIEFIITLVSSMSANFIVIICGIILRKNYDCEINDTFGYRTQKSKSSPETWKFANQLCAKLLIGLGITSTAILITVSLAVYFIAGIKYLITTSIIIECALAVSAILIIPYIENRLKKFLGKTNEND